MKTFVTTVPPRSLQESTIELIVEESLQYAQQALFTNEPIEAGFAWMKFSSTCHLLNVNSGWWHRFDMANEHPYSLKDRNLPEMLMLLVSEVAEEREGELSEAMDDKLPEHASMDVERADVLTRLGDLCGALKWFPQQIGRIPNAELKNGDAHHMDVICGFARIMELVRKMPESDLVGNVAVIWELENKVLPLLLWSNTDGPDLFSAWSAKMRYNQVRKDHRPEVRAAEGGKQF